MRRLSIPLAIVAVVLLACSTADAGWTYVGGVAFYTPGPVIYRPPVPPPIPLYPPVYVPRVYPPVYVPRVYPRPVLRPPVVIAPRVPLPPPPPPRVWRRAMRTLR